MQHEIAELGAGLETACSTGVKPMLPPNSTSKALAVT